MHFSELQNGAFYDPAVDAMDEAETFCCRHKATGQYDFSVIADHADQDFIIQYLTAGDRNDGLVDQLEAVMFQHLTYLRRPFHVGGHTVLA